MYTNKSSITNNLITKRGALFSTSKKVSSVEKQPSKLGIALLAFITIMLYGFGINQLHSSVVDIIEATVEQTTIEF